MKSKKSLPYRFKEISALILRSKTSGNAGQAVLKARAKAATLRQKLRTGEYDDQELQSAIVHADKMVRIAKKRQKHLKEEESAKRLGNLEDEQERQEEFGEDIQAALENGLDSEDGMAMDEEEMREYMRELQKQMRKQAKELQEQMQEEMQEMIEKFGEEDELGELLEDFGQLGKAMDAEDLEQLKKKHRQEELRDIIKADMEYLRAFFGRLEREKQEASSNGVSLELGGMEIPVEMPEAPPMAVEAVSVDTVV